jgi:hypothetical protein
MQLPAKIKYNLSQGRSNDMELERRLVNKICENNNFDLVVNGHESSLSCAHPVTNRTSDKPSITKDLVLNYGVRSMLFYNFVDPLLEQSAWYDVLKDCTESIGSENITTAGFIDTNKFKQDLPVQFWAMQARESFKVYTDEELQPNKLDNVFLCYNRLPRPHRKWLRQQFQANGLLSKGIFTLGKQDPSGEPDMWNDNMSLGPLEAWNSSFLIIVTETGYNMRTAVPFLSEKIWKPIIGMRPFVCVGDSGTIKSLRDAGFETFNSFFGFDKDDLTVSDVTNLVKNYQGDPATDYDVLKDKLAHNRKRFFQYMLEEKNRLGL